MLIKEFVGAPHMDVLCCVDIFISGALIKLHLVPISAIGQCVYMYIIQIFCPFLLQCGYESAHEVSFLDIQLDIKPFGSNKTLGSVVRLVIDFFTRWYSIY